MHRLPGAVLPLVAVLAACGSTSPTAAPSPAASSAASGSASGAPGSGGVVEYVVQNYRFTPITVAPGQVVRVIDRDDEPHTVTAVNGAFDTGTFDASDPGMFTAPQQAGSYAFTCRVHPSMHGVLVVR